MIAVSDLFLRLVCYALVASTAWEAWRGWLRYRDRYRSDILWVVGLLILILLLGDWALVLGSRHSIAGFVFTVLFLSQPYFLLRLVRRFRPVPGALLWLTLAIAVGGATIWSLAALAPPIGWSTIVALYFTGQLAYAAWAFGGESRRSGGVTGARLWYAALGTWLHVAIAVVIGIEANWPAAASFGPELRRLLGLGVFLCYYVGLVAPQQIRALWSDRLIYQFMRQAATRPHTDVCRDAPADLSRAISQGVASVGRIVLMFETQDSEVLLTQAASSGPWTDLRLRPGSGLIGRALARGTPVVGSADDFEPELATLARRFGRSVWAVPLVAGTGRRWGVAVVIQRIGSLFPDDDLEFVSVLASQTAASLEHARLLAIEREHRARVAETRLRDSEARFSQILESILDYAVLVVDETGHVQEWKAGAETTFGYTFEEMRGRSAAALFGRTEPEFASVLCEARLVGHVNEDSRCRRRDGSTFAASTAIRPIRGEETDLAGCVVVTRDETERRALGERLQQAQKMEAVGQLAGGVAHDFNNLLTAVLGYAAMIESHPDYNETLNQHLSEIRRTAERATALTARLLAFSRRQVVEPRTVNLPDLVSDLMPMLDRVLEDRVKLNFTAYAPAGWILADPVQIEQVVLNLAINARDAMPDGGRVAVHTDTTTFNAPTRVGDAMLEPGSYATLTVTDTGIGIDPETRARMFEPFFTTKEIGHGTGLGLSTVYGIVKQLGGGIAVDSERGRGATFRIYLPLTAACELNDSARAAQKPRVASAATILVVDDDDAIRTLVASWLEASGYGVVTAANVAAAIHAVNGDRYVSLLVTDVVMPGESGLALAEKLRQDTPDLPVLYMSGYAHASFSSGPGSPGGGQPPAGSHFLAKPFSRDALLGRVRQILEVGMRT